GIAGWKTGRAWVFRPGQGPANQRSAEIRKAKSEIRNKSQYRISKPETEPVGLGHWLFGFGYCFGFRHSLFEFSLRASLGGRLEGRLAVVQELRQHGVEVLGRVDQGVVDALPGAAAADLDQVLLQGLDVAVAQGARVTEQVDELLHALEAR